MTGGGRTARVRVIVVNYNGGELVLECLRCLEKVDWPRSLLDVIVVDNRSSDGSVRRIEESFPWLRVLRMDRNLGFAGGNNAGLREPGPPYDYVALLNNDAFADENWLAPLLSALEPDPRAGAATSKVLFAPKFVELHMRTTSPVEIQALEVGGSDVSRDARFVRGFDGPSTPLRTCAHDCVIWLPVSWTAERSATARALLRAQQLTVVTFRSGNAEVQRELSVEPAWVETVLSGETFDVINNVGNVLYRDGYGADRGLGERDTGQYDRAEEVFAWCGSSVLLSRRYLEDIGLFEENLFLYYEDFDMAWRGRARGWHYLYVPTSVVRHVHTATTTEGSGLFEHFVERNRLIVTLRNGPKQMVGSAIYGYVRMIAALFVRDVLAAPFRSRRPETRRLARRVRSFASFLVRVPTTLRDRAQLRARQTVSDAEVLPWALSRW